MPRRRDRHGRGIRGPLALPNPYGGWVAQPARPSGRTEFFDLAVRASVERITRHCPEALQGVTLGVEDVPFLEGGWGGSEVPLALAVEPTEETPGQVVVYRRPLEHRAATRQGLTILVHRTIVEQLAAVTHYTADQIDPEPDDED